jgi:mRNA-degrading endonuclease toxin of MazEF toxin-antitoxin module
VTINNHCHITGPSARPATEAVLHNFGGNRCFGEGLQQTQNPMAAVVPLTKAAAKTPLHLRFAPADTGLRMASTVLIDHARFRDRSRLRGTPIGRLQPAALALLDQQLSRVLGLA